ncbi:MAG: chemotaxis response regulator protein-glutamate methylesterase [Candidatus Neomarinimicrobiota bacterium]
MIKIVVVDDSAFMRKALTLMLESDPEIKVVATARDGEEGFEKIKFHQPDLITLDIEMPWMNGLELLDLIRTDFPTPVLVVSSITTAGAEVTLDAMERGAVDFIPKSLSFVALDIVNIKQDLLAKVKLIARRSRFMKTRRRLSSKVGATTERGQEEKTSSSILQINNVQCVAIGVSTGGPPVVQKILSQLPADFPAPIVIAQHMPKEFTKSFANRLNSNSPLNVKEAETGDRIVKGNVYIGQGGQHLVIRRQGFQVVGHLTTHPEELLYHPSADVLISSVAEVYGSGGLGVILTGMGHDGLEGLRELKQRGGKILAQNEESCIVYGMPKAAVDARIADAVLPVEGIIASLNTLTAKRNS